MNGRKNRRPGTSGEASRTEFVAQYSEQAEHLVVERFGIIHERHQFGGLFPTWAGVITRMFMAFRFM
jgi:hypothetical protein